MRSLRTLALALGCCTAALASDLTPGDSVAFLGDSITQFGWQHSSGYVRMCEAAFKECGLDVKVIPAGISGHKSNNMLERLQRDVLDKKPTHMTLSCGVNDVWHGARGVELPQYKENITQIVDKAQAAGVEVILLTSTMIREDADNNENMKLADYNEFLRTLAKEKGCALVDLSAEMLKRVANFRETTGSKRNYLTADGVHMDFLGNRMMAQMILRDGLHFTDDEMKTADEAIAKIPYDVNLRPVKITGADYMRLSEKALNDKTTATAILQEQLRSEAEKAATEALQARLP